MREKLQIIRDLELQIKARYDQIAVLETEAKTLSTAVMTLRGTEQPIVQPIALTVDSGPRAMEFTNYPHGGTLYDKVRYLEDIDLRFWRKSHFDKLIEQIEGPERAKSIIHNSRRTLNNLVAKNQLINIKYNNSVNHSFYSTRREWVEKKSDGTGFIILPQHEPHAELIGMLTEAQRHSDNITWFGIN